MNTIDTAWPFMSVTSNSCTECNPKNYDPDQSGTFTKTSDVINQMYQGWNMTGYFGKDDIVVGGLDYKGFLGETSQEIEPDT